MDKLKKIPKWIYILLIFIIIIAINIIFNDSNSAIKNDSEQTKKYIYESNNNYNKEFEYEDISIAEEAKYEKYIQEEAEEKIINQKVFVRIKEFEEDSLTDESTATKKLFKAIAIDQDNNKWQIVSVNPSELSSTIQNIKIYGLYTGISSDGTMPIIKIYTAHVDSKYIDKSKMKEVGDNYINLLNTNYSKEKFSFSHTEEAYQKIELIYNNKDKIIEITLSIDPKKQKIGYISVNIEDDSIAFTDVDNELWYSIITIFSPELSIDEIRTMIAGAEVDALAQANIDGSYSHDGMPMSTGYYEYKGYELGVNLYMNRISIRKNI